MGFVLKTVEFRQDNAVINFVAKGTDLRGRGEGSQAGERLLTPGDGARAEAVGRGGLGKGRGRGQRWSRQGQRPWGQETAGLTESSEGRLDFPGDPEVRT